MIPHSVRSCGLPSAPPASSSPRLAPVTASGIGAAPAALTWVASIASQRSQQLAQPLVVERLAQVVVGDLERAGHARVLSLAGSDGDQHDVVAVLGAHLIGELETVDAGHVDVEQQTVRLVRRDHRERLGSAERGAHAVAVELEHQRQRGGGVLDIVYELGGPEVLSFRQLLDKTQHWAGRDRSYFPMPFWLAKLFERLLVIILPIIALMIPLMGIGPALYRWRVRSKVFRWYGQVQAIEARALDNRRDDAVKQDEARRLDEIEHAVNALKIPLSFYHEVHLLRAHIDMVRRHLGIDASVPPDARTSGVAG